MTFEDFERIVKLEAELLDPGCLVLTRRDANIWVGKIYPRGFNPECTAAPVLVARDAAIVAAQDEREVRNVVHTSLHRQLGRYFEQNGR